MDDTGKGAPRTTVQMKQIQTFVDTAPIELDTAWDFVNNPFNDTRTDDIWSIENEIKGSTHL